MFVIYDTTSKQWVARIDGVYKLTPTESEAHKFILEALAYSTIGFHFGNAPYNCVVQKV